MIAAHLYVQRMWHLRHLHSLLAPCTQCCLHWAMLSGSAACLYSSASELNFRGLLSLPLESRLQVRSLNRAGTVSTTSASESMATPMFGSSSPICSTTCLSQPLWRTRLAQLGLIWSGTAALGLAWFSLPPYVSCRPCSMHMSAPLLACSRVCTYTGAKVQRLQCPSACCGLLLQVFCLHGGLSPTMDTLDHIRALDRVQEVSLGVPAMMSCRPCCLKVQVLLCVCS